MRAPRTTRLFLIGVIIAWITRGGLFLVSFGAIGPGIGWVTYGSLAPWLAIFFEFSITLALFIAALRGIAPESGAGYAYGMGWVFLLDTVVYCTQIPLIYQGQDAGPWWPVGLICTQIPLAVLSLLLIRSGCTARRSLARQ
jgi:hypothetical protein